MQQQNSEKIAVAFGKLISKRRELLDLTQEDLAGRLEVSRDMVNNLEKGRQDIFPEQLLAFAEALQCTVADLLPDPNTVDSAENLRSVVYGGLVNNDEVLLKFLTNHGSGRENYLSGRELKSKS